MSISLDHVDKIIERTKVSYKEAKDMLDACQGDVVEAIVRIEQDQQNKAEQAENEKKQAFESKKQNIEGQLKFWAKQFMKMIKKLMTIKVKWLKDDRLFLELPLLIVIVVALITMPWSLIALVAPMFFGVKIKLATQNGKVTDVEEWVKSHGPQGQ